ncbi:MAG: hypothetical protein M1541_03445, partial [Acidobacteria bacterium]|nr:hypothetical protein [Acidobacteriota bacterium]
MRGQSSPSRLLLLMLACAMSAAAQFQDLAASDDGAHLYFSSPLRLRGTDASSYEKIFRFVTGEGFQPFAEEERTPGTLPNQSNFYRLHEPDVSGDGAVVSYAAMNDCIGGSGCMFVLRNKSRIVGARGALPLEVAGRVRLSRNGRYALQNQADTVFPETNLIDLTTGERTRLNEGRSPGRMGRQPLTRDGAAVLVGLNGFPGISLWSRTGTRQITPSEAPLSASINDEGAWMIYEATTPQNTFNLHSIQLPDGNDAVLATGAASSYTASITNAGDLVLYVDKQVFAIRPDGTGRKQLTNAADGITAAVVSGNGNLAYAVTGTGRILRIDLAAGGIEELVGRTPVITSVVGAAVPGSMNFIKGNA